MSDAITTGTYNVVYGTIRLSSVNTGGSNIGIGRLAGGNIAVEMVIYIGYATGYYNQTGIENVIVGYESYSQNTGICKL